VIPAIVVKNVSEQRAQAFRYVEPVLTRYETKAKIAAMLIPADGDITASATTG
jgi:hypothetical protein